MADFLLDLERLKKRATASLSSAIMPHPSQQDEPQSGKRMMSVNSKFSLLLALTFSCQLSLFLEANAQSTQRGSRRSTLSYVMDTTASMENDFTQVCEQTHEISSRLETRFTTFNLVPFNDFDMDNQPGRQAYGPVIPHTSAAQLAEDVCRWRFRLSGGGADCPELSLSGLLLALQNSAQRANSIVYVFTDALPKDLQKLDDVLQVSQQRQVRVTFILSGYCNQQNSEGYKAYHTIGSSSGGLLFVLPKTNIGTLINFQAKAIGTQQRPARNLLIAQSEPRLYQGVFVVSRGATQLDVQVSCEHGSPTVIITPRHSAEKVTNISIEHGLLSSVKQPRPGARTIAISAGSRCGVLVTELSEVELSAPVIGLPPGFPPVRDSQTFITIPLTRGTMVSEIVLQTLDGRLLELIPVPSSRARYVANRIIIGPITRPAVNFRVRIGGAYNGAPFQQVAATAISPQQQLDGIETPKTANRTIQGRQCNTISFSCNAKDPVTGRKLIVSWSRDNRLLQSNHRLHLSGPQQEKLMISPLLKSDEGIYVCGSATDFGIVAVASIRLSVQEVQGLPQDCKNCLILQCPRPQVSRWYHNSSVAFNSENYILNDSGQLHACHRPVYKQDGEYRCVTDTAVWTFTVRDQLLYNRRVSSVDEENGQRTQRPTRPSVITTRQNRHSTTTSAPTRTVKRQRTACPRFNNPLNGRVDFQTSHSSGTLIAFFSCNNGYQRSGSRYVFCQENRQWSGQVPRCNLVIVTRPQSFTVTRPTTKPNIISNPGMPKRCPPLSNPQNGFVTFVPRIHGNGAAAALFRCQRTHQLRGNGYVICLRSGRWSDHPPRCIPRSLPPTNSGPEVILPVRPSMCEPLQASNKQLQGHLDRLRTQLSSMQAKASRMQTTYSSLQGRMASANDGLTRMQRETSMYSQQNKALRKRLITHHQQLADCNQKKAAIQQLLGHCPSR